MTSTGHMSVQRGKTVMVHLRDGRKLIKKFLEQNNNYVYFMDNTRQRKDEIRTISIYKKQSDV
jgi:hypothetical protein